MPPTRKICLRLGPDLDQFGTTWPNLATLGRTGLQLCPLLFHPASLLCHPVPLLCCPVAKLGQVGGKLGPTWFQVGPTWGLLGANGTQVGTKLGAEWAQVGRKLVALMTKLPHQKKCQKWHTYHTFVPSNQVLQVHLGVNLGSKGQDRAKNYQDVTKF